MTPDNHDDACPHISGEEAAERANSLTRDQIMLTLNATRPCGCRVTLAVIAEHNGFTENPDWCGCHLLNRFMLIELLATSTSELVTQYARMALGTLGLPPCEEHPEPFQCPRLNEADTSHGGH